LIIQRYLFREILYTLIALTILLLLIYISHRFMVYLVDASAGNLPTQFILQLLVTRLLSDLVLILPLGFFLAILLALGRLYKDNEVTALAACGVGIPTPSILALGLTFALFIGVLSLVVAPWAKAHMHQLITHIAAVGEVSGIAAGRFKELIQGQGIFYVEQVDAEQKVMKTVFAQANLPDRRIVLVAKRSYQTVEAGELYLTFVEGRRYDNKPNALNYEITEFTEHRIRIPKRVPTLNSKEREAVPTIALLGAKDPAYQAELQWRVSLPLSVVLLAMLAVPLSHTTPRQGQYAKILTGILIYLIYNNLLNIAKKWLEQGDISPQLGVWWVHGGLLLIIAILANISFLKSQFNTLKTKILPFLNLRSIS
jgi:lipopolysaccharide export system permease protein